MVLHQGYFLTLEVSTWPLCGIVIYARLTEKLSTKVHRQKYVKYSCTILCFVFIYFIEILLENLNGLSSIVIGQEFLSLNYASQWKNVTGSWKQGSLRLWRARHAVKIFEPLTWHVILVRDEIFFSRTQQNKGQKLLTCEQRDPSSHVLTKSSSWHEHYWK